MLGLADGTVRNYLAYAEAAQLRNNCAPETADQDIAGCAVQDVAAISKTRRQRTRRVARPTAIRTPSKAESDTSHIGFLDQDDLLDQALKENRWHAQGVV